MGGVFFCPKALLQGVPEPEGDGINFNPSFPATCASEMTLLTQDGPTFLWGPIKPMVLWERRSSEVNEHSHLWGCERYGACDDEIEARLACYLSRKSGCATFSTVSPSAQRRWGCAPGTSPETRRPSSASADFTSYFCKTPSIWAVSFFAPLPSCGSGTFILYWIHQPDLRPIFQDKER